MRLDSQGIVLDRVWHLDFKQCDCKARRKNNPSMSGQTDVEDGIAIGRGIVSDGG